MARVKTFNNGPGVSAQILPSDLNTIQDEYELGFATYKHVARRGGTYAGGLAAGTFVMSFEINGAGGGVPTNADYSFYFDPADYAAPGASATPRVTKLRLRGNLWTASTPPATTLTFGMYPVATWGTSTGPQIATLGAVVTGSTVAFAAPAANSQPQNKTADFTAPAAGYYVLAVANSATSAAGANVSARGELQVRTV